MRLSKHCLIVLLSTGLCALASGIGAGASLRLALCLITMALIAWATLFGSVLAHPAESLLVLWCIPGSMHFLHLMYFGHIWPEYPLFYLLGFLGCYLVGFYVSIFPDERRRMERPLRSRFLDRCDLSKHQRLYDFCALLGFVCGVSAILSGASYTDGDYSNMGGVRDAFLSSAPSGWAYVVLLTSPGGVVAFVVALLYQEKLSALRRLAYILAGFSTVAAGVVSAGRYRVVQIVILSVIALAVRRANGLRPLASMRTTIGVSVLIAVLLTYMLALPYYRDRTGTIGYAEFATAIAGVEVDPGLYQPVWQLDSAIRDAAFASYAYLAMPVESFRVFYFVYADTPRFGGYQGGLLTRQIARIFPQAEPYTPTTVLAQRDEEFFRAGEGTTAWQTMVREVVIDFGWVGALIFAWVLGAIGRRIYLTANATNTLPAILALVGVTFISVHSIMYSIVGDPDIMTLILWGAFLWMLRTFKCFDIFSRLAGLSLYGRPAKLAHPDAL